MIPYLIATGVFFGIAVVSAWCGYREWGHRLRLQRELNWARGDLLAALKLPTTIDAREKEFARLAHGVMQLREERDRLREDVERHRKDLDLARSVVPGLRDRIAALHETLQSIATRAESLHAYHGEAVAEIRGIVDRAVGDEPAIRPKEPAHSGQFVADSERSAKRRFIVREQDGQDSEREVWAWHVNEAAILYEDADRSGLFCDQLPQTNIVEVGQLGSDEWKLVRVEAAVWSTSTVIGSRQDRSPLNPGRSDARPPLGREGSGVAGEEGAGDA